MGIRMRLNWEIYDKPVDERGLYFRLIPGFRNVPFYVGIAHKDSITGRVKGYKAEFRAGRKTFVRMEHVPRHPEYRSHAQFVNLWNSAQLDNRTIYIPPMQGAEKTEEGLEFHDHTILLVCRLELPKESLQFLETRIQKDIASYFLTLPTDSPFDPWRMRQGSPYGGQQNSAAAPAGFTEIRHHFLASGPMTSDEFFKFLESLNLLAIKTV